MKFTKQIIWLVLIGFPLFVSAQEKIHPIDLKMNDCLKVVKGVMPRATCYSNASESWKKEVEIAYKNLLKQLSSQQQKILKNEQKYWRIYVGKREKFVMAKYGKRKGSGYISVRILELMKPFRERSLELEERYEPDQPEN